MEMEPIFEDRVDAGRCLAERLAPLVPEAGCLVLALPRGGVPVGAEVARALNGKLDVFLVRKLGLPGHEELAIGAIASGGIRVLNEPLIREVGLSRKIIDQITGQEEGELKRREELYRQGQPALNVKGCEVVLVDDGLATGATMQAAIQALRQKRPKRIIVAVPVAPEQTCDRFRKLVDEVVCAYTPEPFMAVGIWYHDFSPTTDEQVQKLLRSAQQHS